MNNRVIFSEPIQMTELEEHYFRLIDTTSDSYGLSYEDIIRKLSKYGYNSINERDIRMMNEMWNEFKYLNVIPTYNIKKVKTILSFKHKGIKSRFRKINNVSEHSLSLIKNSRLDMIEYITKYRNRLRVHGDVNTLNNMTVDELLNMEAHNE